MFRKLFYGFCNQVQTISTFAQLQNIMNPPTPENYQRLLLTVQQMIQSKPINWKFVHRLQQLREQFNLEIDIQYLLSRLKDQPIDSEKQQFVIDLMQQYFTTDEELFKDLYNQLLRMDDLHFITQLKMLQTYFSYPEFFNQDQVLPRLIQNLIASEDLEVYDLVNAFQIFTYDYPYLTEENRQWLHDLKDEMNQQIIKIIPSLGQKQFKQLLVVLRSNDYYNEQLKEAVLQYFNENKQILGQTCLMELLNLCNLQFYFNEDLKQQILIQINQLKVKGINETKLINRFVLPSISLAEQEMMANLITLSGIQLDKEYVNQHFTGSDSQKKEKLEQLRLKDQQVLQIVKELQMYIDGQFYFYINVMRVIQTFGISLPELLQPMMEELKKILAKQIVNPTDLLPILNYFDDCNILFDQDDCIGMHHFKTYLNQDIYSYQKIEYLQRQLAQKKNQNEMRELLEKSLKTNWNLELCSRQALLYNYFNIPFSKDFEEKFKIIIEEHVQKKRNFFDQQLFFKQIAMAHWTKDLKQEHKAYYYEGQSIAQRLRKEKLKNVDQSSILGQEIKQDILQYMPNTFKLVSNQFVNGAEIDFIITNQKGDKLLVQIHGPNHYYYASTVYNYQTLLETFSMEKLGNYRAIHYYEAEKEWKQQKQQAVTKLLSCLM
ncbi:unnamed protein product (macronuclear) [Paramecium tetraurelia]|uniref:RAP domain-containing protein n=1 Tax=Paramecium tetraurelia TaxID=5888 RepID=A0DDP7_PARTE|nr:uncharacterized protein GSPATT00016005001 [Paramecium tetraurelia]CAK81164.1 unnamed protein product [Paramecium tetraurelia]|eukprot:XP_001448561.1 hypothetical protein (macronuclear) [Paramecium tetraurelia strain d4-2]